MKPLDDVLGPTTLPAVSELCVRRAVREDCPAILAIYNDAVLTTTASYDYEPRLLAHRLEWFDAHQRDDFAVFVAEEVGADGVKRLLGWSALNKFHDRVGYRFTAENSVYVASEARGRRVGSALLGPLIEAAQARGLHAILAVIDAENEASLRLHAKFGFVRVGLFKQVGFKFNRWLDVAYLERLLD
jgi:phosphinothricin acetyltransferase